MSKSSNSVNIQWAAATDNIGVTQYQIFRDGTQVGTSTTTSYTSGGLNPSTPYSYTVKALDAAGNVSAPSGALAVPTDIAPPASHGLKGEYYDNMDLPNLKFTRTDASVNFNWGNGSPDPLIGVDTFSVRWTGKVWPRRPARILSTRPLTTVSDSG